MADAIIDVYARISKAPNGDLEKTDRQIDDCKQDLERRGLTVGKVHEDPNKSAWRKDVRRRGFEALLKRYEDNEISGVIVWNVDRLMRQPRDLEKLIDMAASNGFTVYSCFGDYDLTNPDHLLQLRIKTSFASHESEATQRRVIRGIKAARLAGKPAAGPRAFGWPAAHKEGETATDPVLVATERTAIGEAARRYLAGGKGNGLVDMARDFNARGLRTATGGNWTAETVRQMLTRARNAGLVEHNGVIVGTFEEAPPIDRETYDRVKAKFAAAERGRPVSDERLLTGIARCGGCGRHFNSRTRSGAYYANGQVRIMYYCAWPRGCGKVSVAQPDADLAIEAFVIRRLADPRHASQLAAQADAVRELDRAIAEIEDTQVKLSEKLGRGNLSSRAFDAAYDPLQERLRALRGRRSAEAMPDPTLTAPRAQRVVRERWKAADTPDRRAMLTTALGSVKLYVDPIPEGLHWRRVAVSDRIRFE